jgi:hypothetical protein
LDLLKFDPNLIAKLLLGHADHPATMPNTFSHMDIYWMLHGFIQPLIAFICHKQV